MKIAHLNGLRALEAVLRCGNFRAASSELNVSPAAVGQQIRALEDYLGCKLFLRSTRGVVPTNEARAISNRLTVSLTTIEDILKELGRSRDASRVSITMPASFAENWFTHRIAEFYRQRREVDLRLDASNRMVDLIDEDFDFAIRYCDTPSDRYRFVDLFGDKVIAVCSPQFANENSLDENTRTLQHIPLVHLEHRTPDPDWPDWSSWGTHFGFEGMGLQEGVRISQFSSGLQAALAGQGLVLSGVVEAFDALGDGSLVAPFGASLSFRTGFKYRLVNVAGRTLSPLQKSFRDWIIQAALDFSNKVHPSLD